MNWTGRICSHMFCTHVTNVSKASGQCECVGKKTTKVKNYFIILHFVLWKDLVLLTILSPCPSSMFGRPLITWDGPAPPSDAISMCFFLFTAFSLDSERERWYLVGSAEMGGGSKTLLLPFFAPAPKTIIIRQLSSQWNIQSNLQGYKLASQIYA